MSVFPFNLAFAQPSQVSFIVSLKWFGLQVTYPAEVMPGDTVAVSVQATPKSSSIHLQSLTATVYYADVAGLHLIASHTLVSNSMNGYEFCGARSFSKSFTVSVPQNASRTSLVALFSETVRFKCYPLYYGYGGRLWLWVVPKPWATWLVPYSFETDDAIAPLSYIEATTPEYIMLQQRMKQTQTQNQQLQTTITQQRAMISQLNDQLASANTTAQTYETDAAVFVLIAVALAAFSIYQMRKKAKMKNTLLAVRNYLKSFE
jgi:hypothetical protein